jgi:CheY-like chemotaxis protein
VSPAQGAALSRHQRFNTTVPLLPVVLDAGGRLQRSRGRAAGGTAAAVAQRRAKLQPTASASATAASTGDIRRCRSAAAVLIHTPTCYLSRAPWRRWAAKALFLRGRSPTIRRACDDSPVATPLTAEMAALAVGTTESSVSNDGRGASSDGRGASSDGSTPAASSISDCGRAAYTRNASPAASTPISAASWKPLPFMLGIRTCGERPTPTTATAAVKMTADMPNSSVPVVRALRQQVRIAAPPANATGEASTARTSVASIGGGGGRSSTRNVTDIPTTTPATEADGRPPALRRTRRFLVVEDVPSNLRFLVRLLSRRFPDATFDEARDGVEAVEAVEREGLGAYDVICTDKSMPRMDGDDAVRRIRALGYRGAIVGITGNALPEDQAAFRDAGADSVVAKPVSVDAIAAEVRRLLRGS